MIQYIYGRNGTGKLEYILDNIKKSDKIKNSYIIIPRVETLNVEKAVANEGLSGKVDILTFPLMCKMIFDVSGGNNKKKISQGVKKVLMYTILTKDTSDLRIYNNISKNDASSIDKMLSLHKEFVNSGITYEDLMNASKTIGKTNEHLSDKLHDFSKIFEKYEKIVDERWYDGTKDKKRASEKETSIFDGKDIYIYGFTSMERDELELIYSVIAKCRNIFVVLSYDNSKDEKSFEFISQKGLKKDIDNLILRLEKEKNIKIETLPCVNLSKNIKFNSKELSFLSQNIFSDGKNVYHEKCNDINVYRCVTKIEESYLVGYDICSRLYNIGKDDSLIYGNIAVVCQDVTDYENPIKQVFEKLNIPYYLVDQTNINNDPIVSFMNLSFDCLSKDFEADDVIKLVKNGYFNFEEIEKDQFEKYVYKWGINGKDNYSKEWVNSPYGFEEVDKKIVENILLNVNKIRSHLYNTLSPLYDTYHSENTLYIQSVKMYDYLTNNEIPTQVIDRANALYKENFNVANRLYSLWKNICHCMDELINTLGNDWMCTFEEYIQMFKMALSEYQLQPYETTMDRVIVGSINTIRPYNIKDLYIIGVNDGVFPRDVKESKFLSDKEKRYLVDNSILNITNLIDKRRNDELHLFYNTLCIPTDKLTITYTHYRQEGMLKTKSMALSRMEEMFEQLNEKLYRNLDIEKIWRKEQALECLTECSPVTKQALLSIYREDEEEFLCLPDGKNTSLKILNYTIDEDVLKNLYKEKNMYMSYSKIETYLNCEFKYFCDTFLKIFDDEKAEFGHRNKGDMMHRILETSINKIYELKKNENLEDDEIFNREIIPLIDSTTKEYLDSIHYIDDGKGTFSIMISQLKKAAYRILSSSREIMKKSDFAPTYYELHITESKTDDLHVKPIRIEDDNSNVVLSGYIDRLDIYSQDGKKYIKVVDYKSSDKTISLERIKKGLNTQMLLYLYSVCENGIYDGNKKIVDEKTLIPAGVIYLTASSKTERVDVTKKKDVNALILDDDNIVKEFENEGITSKERFVLEEGQENSFEEIKTELKNIVLNVVAKMKKGEANTYSKETAADLSPCSICRYKELCRNSQITKY